MKRKALFVMGCESSGTRMITQFFIRAGYDGDHGHSQPWDNLEFRKYPDNIVFRQSVPHGGRWADIVGITQKMEMADYITYHVLTWRDPRYMALSQVKAGHVATTNEALSRIARAIEHIDSAFSEMGRSPITIVYEKFVSAPEYPKTIHGLFTHLKYELMSLKNANDKYTDSDVRSLNADKLHFVADRLSEAEYFAV